MQSYSAPKQQSTSNTTTAPTFKAAYAAATNQSAPSVSSSSNKTGNAGVQFGAFSSRSAAQSQVDNVKSKLGVTAEIEAAPNGMFRVRANNLSESAAQDIRNRAQNNGIDCYIFH